MERKAKDYEMVSSVSTFSRARGRMLLIPLQFRLRLKAPGGRFNEYSGRELLGQRRAINQYPGDVA